MNAEPTPPPDTHPQTRDGVRVPIVTLLLGETARVPAVVTRPDVGPPLDFALDTGADAHVIFDAPFVILGGRHGGRAGRLSDGTGRQTDVRLVASPALHVGPAELTPLVHVPGSIGRELAGAFSPARAARASPLQIDLVAGELRFGEAIVAREHDVVATIAPCEGATAAFHARVPVEIDGVTFELTIDTAASHTWLFVESLLGTTLEHREVERTELVGAPTGSFTTPIFGEMPVRVGGRELTATLGATRRPRGCGDGLLGFDVLQRCVIDLDEDRVGLSCDPSAAPAASVAAPRHQIDVSAVDVEAACGVDARTLARLSTPPRPWRFDTYSDIVDAVNQSWLDADPGDLMAPVAAVIGACRESQDTHPRFSFSWRRGDRGLVMVLSVTEQSPL